MYRSCPPLLQHVCYNWGDAVSNVLQLDGATTANTTSNNINSGQQGNALAKGTNILWWNGKLVVLFAVRLPSTEKREKNNPSVDREKRKELSILRVLVFAAVCRYSVRITFLTYSSSSPLTGACFAERPIKCDASLFSVGAKEIAQTTGEGGGAAAAAAADTICWRSGI
jgi:hypothetical protein